MADEGQENREHDHANYRRQDRESALCGITWMKVARTCQGRLQAISEGIPQKMGML